jgi:hypothetical protein
MNFRKLGLAALAVGVIGVPAQSPAQFDRNTIQTIAVLLLAEKLGIDPTSVLGVLPGTNADIFQVAPAFAMQRYAPSRSVDSIWELRQRGMGWGEIANAIGMQPGEFNKLRNSGMLDPNVVWRSTYRDRWSLNDDQINRLRRMGFDWGDTARITVIARESGNSIFTVADRYSRYRNWDLVARSFNVTGARVTQTVSNWRTSRTMPTRWRTVTATPTRWRTTTTSRPSSGTRVKSKSSGSHAQKMKSSGKARAKVHKSSGGSAKMKFHGSAKAKASHGKGKGKSHGHGGGKGKKG